MPVVLVSPPGFTRAQYEESVRKLTGGKARVSSLADWPVKGLLAHIAGESPSGFRVVDIWESREALDRFGAVLMPIFAEIGVKGEPEIYETHTFVSG
jgi:hypothetical protein